MCVCVCQGFPFCSYTRGYITVYVKSVAHTTHMKAHTRMRASPSLSLSIYVYIYIYRERDYWYDYIYIGIHVYMYTCTTYAEVNVIHRDIRGTLPGALPVRVQGQTLV